jgi:hypothetical protein
VKSSLSLRTTFVELALAFAIRPAVNWSRFSSCWDTSLYKTTERYLGCKQRFRNAVNDRIGLEPDKPESS